MSESICNCIPSLDRLATCDITNRTIKRKGNSWISPMNGSVLIFENCPFDYCNNETFASDNPSEQCNYERSGTLCGDCLPGYSLTLGSNECRNCTEHVRQTTPVVLIMASCLASIGLVVVLTSLNLTVSVGTINGLLFFVNVVKLYEPIFRWYQFHWSLRYVISWLNLDLGMPTCFYCWNDSLPQNRVAVYVSHVLAEHSCCDHCRVQSWTVSRFLFLSIRPSFVWKSKFAHRIQGRHGSGYVSFTLLHQNSSYYSF